MTPRTTLHIHDSARDGAVSASLRAWRGDGKSVPEIVRLLNDQYTIIVGERTVYRWLDEIERVAS